MDDPERPGPDADASEIAAWMEDHFGRSLLEGIRDAVEDNEQQDASDEGESS